MNQRRDARTLNPIIVLTLVGLLVAGAVYWFVIRDDSSSDSKAPNTAAAKTFTAPGNSFSFKYPGRFIETSGGQGYVWIAGIGPYDIMSVKRIANQPTAPARLIKTIPGTLSAVPGTTITNQGTDKRDGLDLVTFALNLTISGHAVAAKLYYFSANGVTWQLGCESENEAATINAACAAALQSFKAS